MGVVQESVDGSACEKWVAEEACPLGNVAVRCDDGRRLFVARPNEFVEIDGLLSLEWCQAQIVDN